jgi:hypothetical protein
MRIEFLLRSLLENRHLEDREGGGRNNIRWVLGTEVCCWEVDGFSLESCPVAGLIVLNELYYQTVND